MARGGAGRRGAAAARVMMMMMIGTVADARVIKLPSGLELVMPESPSVDMAKRPAGGDEDAPALVMILHGIGGAPVDHAAAPATAAADPIGR